MAQEKGPDMITQALESDDGALLGAQMFDHYSDAIFAYLYRLVGNRDRYDPGQRA